MNIESLIKRCMCVACRLIFATLMLTLALPSIFSASAFADAAPGAWPMFGHDAQHTFSSAYKGVSYPMKHKWQHKLDKTGYGFTSSPVIGADGAIYVTSRHNDFSTGYLHAFNPDGSLKWERQADIKPGYSNPFWGDPAIGQDGNLYIQSAGYLYIIKSDGSLQAKLTTDNQTYVTPSPVIGANGNVYVATNHSLYIVQQGKSLKKLKTLSHYNYYTPAIATDGTVYFPGDDALYALRPDGATRWRLKYQTGEGSVSSPSVGADGTIYVVAINKNNGSYSGAIYAINNNGKLKWTYPVKGYGVELALASNGTLYAVTGGITGYEQIHAINPDGSLKWRLDHPYYGFPTPTIGADGAIYLPYDYHIVVLNANGSSRWDIPMTDPGIAVTIGGDGTLYTATYNSLWAFGLPEGRGDINGLVSNLTTGIPIANVKCATAAKATNTTKHGRYGLILNPGHYDLSCRKTGYQDMNVSNVAVVLGHEKEVNIEMTPPGLLSIVTPDLPAGEGNIQYGNRVRITGGHAPYNYSLVNGTLPPGVELAPANGIISGVPVRSGNYFFAIGVADSQNAYAERSYTIAVTSKPLKIITVGLKTMVVGQAYRKKLVASGGAGAYHWSLAGNLPEGVKFNQTSGVFSGVPVTAGSEDLTVTVSDEDGGVASKPFTLKVIVSLNISTVVKPNGF